MLDATELEGFDAISFLENGTFQGKQREIISFNCKEPVKITKLCVQEDVSKVTKDGVIIVCIVRRTRNNGVDEERAP